MTRETVRQAYDPSALLLTDGGIETRLIYEFGLDLPEFASFLPLFREGERHALDTIYRGYMEIALRHGRPMQVGTPTWRAHPDCLVRLGFTGPGDLERVNRAAVSLLTSIRSELDAQGLVFIAGVIGPRRDGYDPTDAPDARASFEYHRAQAQVLAGLGVDLLYAPTFASGDELRGVAEAMARTGLPYMVAPVIDEAGRLPDGQPLTQVIAAIDAADFTSPVHHLVGCVHPARFRAAAIHAHFASGGVLERLKGLKGNASSLPPDQLDKLDHLEEGKPQTFAKAMAGLHRDFGLSILGGCCGTSDRHIEALAQELFGPAPVSSPSARPAA